jgi:type IV pilus assembly protein PilC
MTENINKIELEEDNFILFKKVKDKDKYNFYEYLSIMLNSGVGLADALS